MKNKNLMALAIGAVSTALMLILLFLGALDSWDWRIDDALTRITARTGEATDTVAVVLLDQASLDWAEETMGVPWPWPREFYALVTDFAARGEPRALGFDVIYSEESFYGPYDDETYALSLEANGNVVGTVFLSEDGHGESTWPAAYPAPLAVSPPPPDVRSMGMPPGMNYAQFPVPDIGTAYAALANVQVSADQDGVFRRVPPALFFDGMAVPSLALAMYQVGGVGEGRLEWKGRHTYLDGEKLMTDRNGNLSLRYRGPSGTHPTYNAAEVLRSEIQILSGENPQLDPEVFRDKFILFGFSAPGLKDLRSSPIDPSYSGVEIHATMLDNLLSDDFYRPVPGTGLAWNLILITLTMLLSLSAARSAMAVFGWWQSALVYLAFISASLVLPGLPWLGGVNLPIVPSIGAILLSLIIAGIINFTTEGNQRRKIKGYFTRYISRDYVEQLVRNPEPPRLGGEKRNLTIFFSDLQGFTTISEGLDPEALTALLNRYLTAMVNVIRDEEGGTIDKFEGDAIIAFWNAPLDLADHAVRGIRASLRCQEVLDQIRPELAEMAGGKDVLMRIGMNTGPAIVGNMGSEDHFNYTMLGDAVNLAARLEGVNKQFGTFTMVSEATLFAARDHGFQVFARELARVEVVGKSEPVTVYEPMTNDLWNQGEGLWRAFADALSLFYEGRFKEAGTAFASLADRDPVSKKYLAKLEAMGDQPPADWNGVWVMTSK